MLQGLLAEIVVLIKLARIREGKLCLLRYLRLLILLGMGYYLDMFNKNLDKQNEKSIFYLRNELTSFYGMMNFVQHFDDIGSKAVSRSQIHGTKKNSQLLAISYVGKVRIGTCILRIYINFFIKKTVILLESQFS